MKKILALLLAVVLVVGALPMAAFADEYEEWDPTGEGKLGDVTWRISAETHQIPGTEDYPPYEYKTYTLTISGNGALPGFASAEDAGMNAPWRKAGFTVGKGGSAKALIIEPGVTSIGNYAFTGFHVESITIADTVTTIGDYAFAGAGGDGQNTLPMEVLDIHSKNIGKGAIGDLAKTIILHEGFNDMKSETISGGTTEKVYLPASLTKFASDAMVNCFALTDIYYGGTEEQFKANGLAGLGYDKITMEGDWLPEKPTVTIHYNTPAPGDVVTPPTPEKPTFTDVPEGIYFADAVKWAVEKGITAGVGDGTQFDPYGTCTRGQIVTFLWRANGKPTVSGGTSFTDVEADSYYEKAVKWAVANGITSGTGDGTTFSPNDPCDRAQAVTFMWRAANKPTVSGSTFGDVQSGSYYEDAVKWAVSKNITSGTGDGTTFSPNDLCQRNQIVTFLYRGK